MLIVVVRQIHTHSKFIRNIELNTNTTPKSPRSAVDRSIELLTEGYTIVVGTHRLRHLVLDGYNLEQINQNKTSWVTPEIFSWNSWLRNVWYELELSGLSDRKQLLSPNQSLHLWERQISGYIRETKQEGYEYLLWHITSTAKAARDAYRSLNTYQIDKSEFPDVYSEDVGAFLEWLRTYQESLHQKNLVDFETLPQEIISRVGQVADLCNPNVAFSGIEEWTPQHQSVVDSLVSAGMKVEIVEIGTRHSPNPPQRVDFDRSENDSVDNEIEACARWARQAIEADPENHRIGIAVPNLSEVNNRIRRKFAEILNPNAMMEKRQSLYFAFHDTLGTPMSEIPLIVDIFNLLELMRPKFELTTISAVIRSDRIHDWKEEKTIRSRLAVELPQLGSNKITLNDVVRFIRSKGIFCPKLYKILTKAQTILEGAPARAEYADWGKFIAEWIELFQSTSLEGRSFGADEFKAHTEWGNLVENISEFGFLGEEVSIEEIVVKLRRAASEQIVQLVAVRSPIQIGGPSSLAGQSFTHLWMMGLNNENVPGTPRPSPFIPISVQRKHELPNATPASTDQRVRRVFNRLLSNSSEVILSYAKRDGDHQFEPSSWLLSYDNSVHDVDVPRYETYLSRIASDSSKIEEYCNWNAEKVQDTSEIRGGTSLFRNQSLCPFKAFGEHRLRARQLDDVQVGISPLDHGTWTHAMFEELYKEFKTLESLQGDTNEDEYVARAKKLAKKIVEESNSKRICPLSKEVLDNQVARMTALARQWFHCDSNRSEFEVLGHEQEIETSIGELPVRMKIDRVDKTPDGIEILDYKTGYCSLSDLKGERPREPQLMLYMHAYKQQGETVQGVGYARVRVGDTELLLEGPNRRRKESEETWEDAEVRWDRVLHQLSGNFMKGDALADPISNACDYCHLGVLCRINEVNEWAPDDEEGKFDHD